MTSTTIQRLSSIRHQKDAFVRHSANRLYDHSAAARLLALCLALAGWHQRVRNYEGSTTRGGVVI